MLISSALDSDVTAATKLTDEGALDSITMAVMILEELSRATEPMGVTQLHHVLGTSKPRIYRYLSSLRHHGLVEQNLSTERYSLGWKLLLLGEAASKQLSLQRKAEPYLLRLRDLTGLTAMVSIPVAGRAVVIATAESFAPVSITVRPGNRPAAHCSAQGRVVLAYSSAPLLDSLLKEPLQAYTTMSMTSRAELLKRLKLIRSRLYDEAPSEARSGINTIAAPVFNASGDLQGCLAIIGSLEDIPTPPNPMQLRLVQAAAASVCSVLRNTSYEELSIPRLEDIETQ